KKRSSARPCGPSKSSRVTCAGSWSSSRPRRNSRSRRMVELPGAEALPEPLRRGGLVQAAAVRPEPDDEVLAPTAHIDSHLQLGVDDAEPPSQLVSAHVLCQ